MLNPSGIIQEPVAGAYNQHWHTPGFGGEVAWNDIQLIARLNGEIQRHNFNIVKHYNPSWTLESVEAAAPQDPERWALKQYLAPYVLPMDAEGYPVQGYNQHTHINQFDGGGIYGIDNVNNHFAYYHPGTRTPMRSLRIEV